MVKAIVRMAGHSILLRHFFFPYNFIYACVAQRYAVPREENGALLPRTIRNRVASGVTQARQL